MKIRFTEPAGRDFRRLDVNTRQRIGKKLNWLAQQESPLDFAEPLVDSRIGRYRFRIGDYRIIFDIERGWITVGLVGHRREIYKKI